MSVITIQKISISSRAPYKLYYRIAIIFRYMNYEGRSLNKREGKFIILCYDIAAVDGAKEGRKGGKNKSAIAISSKLRSRRWRNGKLVDSPLSG